MRLFPSPRHAARRLRPFSTGTTTAPSSIFRFNVLQDNWVVFSSGRQGRPRQTQGSTSLKTTTLPKYVADCPFCRGNEANTPPASLQLPLGSTDEDWELRVVPNKYPAVGTQIQDMGEVGDGSVGDPARQNAFADPTGRLLGDAACVTTELPAHGHHEVVIETPAHNCPLGSISNEREGTRRVSLLLEAFHTRGRQLMRQDPQTEHLIYFKNQGGIAGASLMHPHSQIVALPFVPRDVKTAQESHVAHFERFGRCVFDQVSEEELQHTDGEEGSRVVDRNDRFVSFIPFAATSPFNVYIVPLQPGAHFLETSPDDRAALAPILWRALRRLSSLLDEPDFNLVLRSAPLPGRHRQRAYQADAFFRYHITVTPRLGSGAMAGFEMGSGIFSNGNMPDADAAALRSVEI